MLGSVKWKRTTASMGKEKESENQDFTYTLARFTCMGLAFK